MLSVNWKRPAVTAAMAAAAVGALAAPAAAAPGEVTTGSYAVTDLGLLPGADYSWASAINEAGDVVGGSGSRAVLWRDGAIIDLGTLGGGFSAAQDVNENGEVVGYSGDADGGMRGFRWRDGAMVALDPLPGDTESSASKINDRGEVLGSSGRPDSLSRSVLWRPDGSMVDLAALTGFQWVADLDDEGRFVGAVSDDGMNGHPALWYRGRTTRLSEGYGSASAINDRGEIAGMYHGGTVGSFFWRRGRLAELPPLADLPPGELMQAQALNNRGQVVGWAGFVWDTHSNRVSRLPGLREFATAASDIDDRGRIVGSAGTSPENLDHHAVLLTPIRG
jgi:probable HAF family extracellular repeat protein